MIIDNRKADQPASQSAKKEKILQDDYNTKISPVKEEDYYAAFSVYLGELQRYHHRGME